MVDHAILKEKNTARKDVHKQLILMSWGNQM